MSRGFPSMTALLGLLAVAGYQNRDKLAEMLGGLQQKAGTGAQEGRPLGQPGGAGGPGGQGGMLDNLGSMLGGTSVGTLLTGGLRELVDGFKQKGHGDVAESWVGPGPNKQIAPPQLEQAIGSDVLETLSQQTGLSRQELLARLSKNLPEAVDKYTPDGRLPT
ncbi:MAG TPA: YidB family protein [Xanthobacteraceae bacterium]|jgi:uncharacterized protein YidB (DUF937 family)